MTICLGCTHDTSVPVETLLFLNLSIARCERCHQTRACVDASNIRFTWNDNIQDKVRGNFATSDNTASTYSGQRP